MPACFSMLLSVPIGISRTGCGTVTRPGFTGCLNCLWLPTCATSYQPSCFKRCMTSRLDIRHDTHFIHTCQVGVYRSDRREPSAYWRRRVIPSREDNKESNNLACFVSRCEDRKSVV